MSKELSGRKNVVESYHLCHLLILHHSYHIHNQCQCHLGAIHSDELCDSNPSFLVAGLTVYQFFTLSVMSLSNYCSSYNEFELCYSKGQVLIYSNPELQLLYTFKNVN